MSFEEEHGFLDKKGKSKKHKMKEMKSCKSKALGKMKK